MWEPNKLVVGKDSQKFRCVLNITDLMFDTCHYV